VNEMLSSRFRELRRIRGVSGVQIAQKMGVSKAYVSQIENGKRVHVDPAKLLKLASRLGVNLEWLITGRGDPSKPTESATLSVFAGIVSPSPAAKGPSVKVRAREDMGQAPSAESDLARALDRIEEGCRAMRKALKGINRQRSSVADMASLAKRMQRMAPGEEAR
jgi:DNA-binding XRE family transcriptional regulator